MVRGSRLRLGLMLMAVLGLGAALAWYFARRPASSPAPTGDDDPRLASTSPFRNVRPEVKYVGDAACADCHPTESTTYRRHPMGRSFAPTPERLAEESFVPAARPSFVAVGLHLWAEPRGGRLFHGQAQRDEQGPDTVVVEREVQYVMGSGRQGRSYLVEREGCLYQSPISWYQHQGRWDLSPGYDQTYFGFNRRVSPACLFCHCNDADHVAGSANRYRTPIFRGHAIGCERCHGPGELHIRRRTETPEDASPDDTIVNPARLEPDLREAVCQQCHLQGEARVLRRGRSTFDFRPGLPLESFLTTFVTPPEQTVGNKAVSHTEQMVQSRCYTGSRGAAKALGCTSCHDPHRLPTETERDDHYRKACLGCHETKPCSVPVAERRRTSAADVCVACHMPANPSGNVAHTAVTDHRVPRRPGETPPTRMAKAPGRNSLAPFHTGPAASSGAEARRDLGLALGDVARRMPDVPLRTQVAREMLEALEPALRQWPEDVAAWEAKAYGLGLTGRGLPALQAAEEALARAPDREMVLVDALERALERERFDDALRYARRLGEVAPAHAPAPATLARLHAQRGEWSEADRAASTALRLDPANQLARVVRLQCLRQRGEVAEARETLRLLLALRPPNAEALRREFADLLR